MCGANLRGICICWKVCAVLGSEFGKQVGGVRVWEEVREIDGRGWE